MISEDDELENQNCDYCCKEICSCSVIKSIVKFAGIVALIAGAAAVVATILMKKNKD